MMTTALPNLRLVRDDAPAGPAPEDVIDALNLQISELKQEINLLRRRDETLHFNISRIDEELRLAARLQQDFLPKSIPQIGRVNVHTLFRPAGYVSGDLYDVMRLDETHMGFYMADAVGHGMPAALLTMFIKNALLTKEIFATGGYRLLAPEETLARLNAALCGQQLSAATFATACYGTIDASTLTVRFARAGHPHPLLLKPDGTMLPIDSDGGLLGICEEEIYSPATVQLEPGDRLIIHSDGVEVAFAGEGPVDTHQWQREIFALRDRPAADLIAGFCEQMDATAGSLTPRDDLTMIVIEIA